MGCTQSKKKSKSKKGEKRPKEANNHHDDGGGKVSQEKALEFQDFKCDWQLILKEVLSANGNQEGAELLKGHGDLVALVQSFADKVKTETEVDLNVLHEQKSKDATEEHERRLEELQTHHDQEKTTLTEAFQTAENLLKGKVDELATELRAYNELMRKARESTFKRDLERNIQAHGSPGAFWESEQESLLFVIEMKSNRVQEQNTKLLEMHSVVEKNLLLEDQIVHVLQQNEDLSVRIDNYQSLIQQLSKEQQEMQRTMERQTSVNQKLGQEKEELMFKLRHKDSCPTIHLPAIVPERAPR